MAEYLVQFFAHDIYGRAAGRGWKLRPENKAGIPAGMEKAVQEFQREQKLEPDGVIGRDTWPKVLDVPVEAILGTHGWGNPEKEKIECHEKN